MNPHPWLQSIIWAETPKCERAPTLQLQGVAAHLDDIQELVDCNQASDLDPSWVRRLRYATRRIRRLLAARARAKPRRTPLPGHRPGQADRPLF